MKKITTKKVEMTQIFADNGEVFPVTLVVAPKETNIADFVDGEVVTVSGTSKGKGFQGVVKRHWFKEGDIVTVSGTSKGKGFQGVVKRHKFKGGRRSHGQKHSEREPGSIGGGGRAGGRVAKGMRMAGRMGGERVTVKNLKLIKVLPESGEIYISGAVPGRRGSKVEIKVK